MGAFERAVEVTQNNVANASVPTYARQRLALKPRPFAPEEGLTGGVAAGAVESARDRYADAELRRQLQEVGWTDQFAASLSRIAARFDATGRSGLPAEINRLLGAFSQWGADPNSQTARANVIYAATALTASFQNTAAALEAERTETSQGLSAVVGHINQLAARVRSYNAERLRSGPDAGRDANLQAALEELAELAEITAAPQADGTVTVLLGGETPLVVGTSSYALRLADAAGAGLSEFPGGIPPAAILDSAGRDVTEQAASGQTGALLAIRNRILPSLIGDRDQVGDLNQLATGLAGRVNQLLTSGWVSDGDPPQIGEALFAYDSTNAVNAARTLTVRPEVTADSLAAIEPGPPYIANGIAMKLAGLGRADAPENTIDGQDFITFYGGIATRVGTRLNEAENNRTAAAQAAAQARSLREQISGVSLDEEAIYLLQFQRAYQAAARMIVVLDDLTKTTLEMLR
jgi:flagellar hook-associated protein 1 FlgK